MENNIDKAMQYFEAWRKMDRSNLKLHQDMHHISPDNHFKSAEEFLTACWGKFNTFEMYIKDTFESENKALIIYAFEDKVGAKLICERFTFENDLIKEIRVWY